MAELLQRFSGNPFTTTVGQKIEQATDPSLASENWALNMEICDAINDTDEGPRDAVRAIKKRLQQNAGKNFTVVMFTLTVLEACVKNCGKRFHLLVTNKDFVQDLVKLIGPKNDPPAVVQEKVLSLIQSWAQAFRGQSELQGVVQVYNELKSKGIEFPTPDADALALIHTPQRSKTPASQPQEAVASSAPMTAHNNAVSSQASLQSYSKTAIPTSRRPVVTPMHLSPEQLAKLKSELDVVQANMRVFNEMLTELTPGKEHNDDWELLSDLNNTCQSMQTRIVELIEKVANEEVTNELLRVNDELNNLFLRYERYFKKHKPNNKSNEGLPTPQRAPQLQTQQKAPQVQTQQQANEPTLIDFTDDSTDPTLTVTNRLANIQMSGINATAGKPVESNSGDLDFDIFAQSRSASNADNSATNDLNTNQPDLPSVAFVPNDKPIKEVQVGREQDFDEMEKWLKDEPTTGGTEFERFLAERAIAVERQPVRGPVGQPKDKPQDDSLL